jgi:glycosyltransferase involved in cell wall biosynthesis
LTSPEVSVVLPSRDRPELLERSLACALGQDGVEVEVIVIDDGSAPALHGRVAALDDHRVTLLRHDRARGVASARNAGIAAARRPFIAFLDDDDVWSPEKLAAQVEALEATGAGFSYTGTVWVDGELQPHGAYRPCPAERLRADLREANVIGSPSAVVARTDVVRAAGGFDERLAVLADWELWLRLADHAEGAAVDDLLLGYVVHGAGMHLRDTRAIRSELAIIRRAHPGDPEIGGLGFWQWFASSQRRVGDRLGAARAHAHMGVRFHRRRDLARAVGLLFGERAMRLGSRSLNIAPPPVPPWLAELARSHHAAGVSASG